MHPEPASFQVIHEEQSEYWYTRCPNILFSLPLTPSEFKYYLYMRSIAGDTGCCFQSRATIEKETGISERKQQDANKKLRRPFAELGGKSLIRVYQTKKEDGSPGTTQIIIVNIWDLNRNEFKNRAKKQNIEPEPPQNLRGGVPQKLRDPPAKIAGKQEPMNKNNLLTEVNICDDAPISTLSVAKKARARKDYIQRREHVKTTQVEHEAMVAEFGAERVEQAYDLFNKWQATKAPAKRRKNHAACMRDWVFRRLDEDDEKRRAAELLKQRNDLTEQELAQRKARVQHYAKGPPANHSVQLRNECTTEERSEFYNQLF